MCFWVLPISGVPIIQSTVQALSDPYLRDVDVRKLLQEYDEAIKEKLGDHTVNEASLSFEKGTPN
jgi:NDP-sugar pyrophosphorylase family protein